MDLEKFRNGDNKILLSFSGGKDSLCSWLVLRENHFEVIPFYMALIPELAFIEDSLTYYERFFHTHIYRTLHPNLYADLSHHRCQPPYRKEIINDLNLPGYDYLNVADGVRRTVGAKKSTWVAVGVRRADSRLRAQAFARKDHDVSKKLVYPIVDYPKEQVIDTLKKANVKLPIDYQWFGRSFDGVDYRFLSVIKQNAPEDYQRILEWYPQAGMELYRAQIARTHEQAR